ncbi:MAG TPA: flagellar biosynthetic protein FliO [Pirellulales bacterium]|jgi:flagellar biogenesis protein FliO|nr:flagellar biosynthetic protein FliO [Pirellulales bacterium]
MPSIHAILLVALGGVLGADARDDPPRNRPVLEDPFLAPVDYRSAVSRQPSTEAGGNPPPTVRLAQPPLPSDFGPIGRGDASATGAAAIDGDRPAGSEAPSGEFGGGAMPGQQWDNAAGGPPEGEPARGANLPRQTAALEPPAAPPAGGHRTTKSFDLPRPNGGGELLPHVLPTVAWPVVVGSLSGVIGLFLIVAWLMRRGSPRAGGLLPREVVEVLGRAPLADRRQMQLLRLGNKLVLIAVSPTGIDTLAEITDPAEVDRLTGFCYQGHPNSSTVAFHKVFKSFEAPAKRKSARGAQRVGFADLERLDFDESSPESDHVR